MLKYFIGFLLCCLLLFIGVKCLDSIEHKLNELAGWRTDVLFISSLIFVTFDGLAILHFISEFFSILLIR